MQKKFLLGVIALTCLVQASIASAIVLDVMTDKTMMDVGDIVTVDVSIDGLGSGMAPSLGVFDIDLLFDPALFMPLTVTFGDQLDLAGFGSVQSVFSFSGGVNVFELSLDSPVVLDGSQLDSFNLFSVAFEATSFGSGVFNLSSISLGDSNAAPLQVDSINPATVRVKAPSAIPVPAAAWLFGTALAGLLGFVRHKKITGR